MALNFLRSPLEFIDSLTQQYGSTVGLKLGGEQVVLTGDLCLSRQVLIDQADVFGKVAFQPMCCLLHLPTCACKNYCTGLPQRLCRAACVLFNVNAAHN